MLEVSGKAYKVKGIPIFEKYFKFEKSDIDYICENYRFQSSEVSRFNIEVLDIDVNDLNILIIMYKKSKAEIIFSLFDSNEHTSFKDALGLMDDYMRMLFILNLGEIKRYL